MGGGGGGGGEEEGRRERRRTRGRQKRIDFAVGLLTRRSPEDHYAREENKSVRTLSDLHFCFIAQTTWRVI